MGPTKFLNRVGLGIKLNGALVLTFGVLLIAISTALSANVRDLTVQITRRRIEQETEVIRTRIQESEQDLLTVSGLAAKSPGLIQFVADGDAAKVQTLILVEVAPLKLDNIKVFDSQGKLLAALQNVDTDDQAENKLISLGILGAEVTGVITGNNGQVMFMASAIPLKQGSGTIVGVLVASRKMDQAFLTGINFGRQDVHLSLISSGRNIAQDASQKSPDTSMLPEPGIQQALAGETWIDQNLSYTSDATPRSRAFVPLKVGGDTYAVLMVENELQEVVTLQNQLLFSTATITVLLGLLAVGASILLIRQNVTAPIAQLKLIAQRMAAGNYRERAKVTSTDEIGQLAEAFNTMADRLHQYTSQLIVELEQRVVEAQAARERAERADKVKSAFLASVSHELRTPLNSVINFTKFVTKGVMGPINDRQRDSLDKVINSAKHLLHLINDVLDMSKIESGSLPLFVEDNVNLNEILQSVVSTAEGLLAEKPVKLLQEIEPDLPLLTGDRQRILQIMLNVVSNACKFTDAGAIKITARQRDAEFHLAVQDSGPGIAPEDRGAVFEPFQQTETGLRQGEGTGLGMPISKSLAEAHGGRLWFESVVGVGTTFYVSLPMRSTLLTPVPA